MAIDVEKLSLLRSIANALAERDLVDVNLLFHEAEFDEISWGSWYQDGYDVDPADRAAAVLSVIRDANRSAVDELGVAVRQLFEAEIEVETKEDPKPLFVFASHLESQRALVGEVGKHLADWGIQLFVAHESIEPDLEWHGEIERALRSCDAGVVFMFPGILESRWCDQEVGWMLGRELPCYALKFQGEAPYGPLGKKQAFAVRDEMTSAQIGDAIVDWLGTKPALLTRFNASLVEALKMSGSFNRTDRVWARLHTATGMGSAEVAGILSAVRDNDQVYKARGGVPDGETGPYAELAFKLVLRQPGFEANGELAAEVARLRGLENLLPSAVDGPNDRVDESDVPF